MLKVQEERGERIMSNSLKHYHSSVHYFHLHLPGYHCVYRHIKLTHLELNQQDHCTLFFPLAANLR
jgi:hypothetical protein